MRTFCRSFQQSRQKIEELIWRQRFTVYQLSTYDISRSQQTLANRLDNRLQFILTSGTHLNILCIDQLHTIRSPINVITNKLELHGQNLSRDLKVKNEKNKSTSKLKSDTHKTNWEYSDRLLKERRKITTNKVEEWKSLSIDRNKTCGHWDVMWRLKTPRQCESDLSWLNRQGSFMKW